MNPVHTIPHYRSRQAQVSGRADKLDPLPQIEVHDVVFQTPHIRTMDEIEAIGTITEIGLDTIDLLFDLCRRQTCRTVETEHPGSAHGFDNVRRADPVSHGPRETGVSDAMVSAERRIAELFDRAGRDVSFDWERAIARVFAA